MRLIIAFFLFLSYHTSFSQDKPIVLVELFTSEGCSSCPAADLLLSTILKRESEEAQVIGLSYHVDYWDYIGWKDPYSDARFTRRQREYARKLNSSVYTPQMVVNGRREIVGSSEVQWKHAYGEEVKASSVIQSNLFTGKLEGDQLTLILDVPKRSTRVIAAVVERELSQSVSKGENRGRTLAHDNVVRVFELIEKPKTGENVTLTLPADITLEKSKVVLYTQDPQTLQINQAREIDLVELGLR